MVTNNKGMSIEHDEGRDQINWMKGRRREIEDWEGYQQMCLSVC